jgi:Mrp family chromosome partitioning ATPase
VIFDVAPVLGAPDASVLAMNVGQVLLVVEANRTGRAAVAETISLLKGCPNISLVLNKVDASELVDYYGSYYGQPYKVPDAGRMASIPERIAAFVGSYLRRWHKPS